MADRESDRPLPERYRHRILVTRFSALGDVAMTIPVVYSVARGNEDCEIVVVTRPSMTTMFVNAPANVIVKGVNLNDYKGMGGLWRLAGELMEEYRPDMMADLHGVLRTYVIGLYMRLHGVKVATIDKGRRGKRALTRRRAKIMLPLTSQRARYREVFYRLGLAVDEHFTTLYGADGKGDAKRFSFISAPKKAGEKWLGIAPFAKHAGKIYPPELMKKVLDGLLAAYPTLRVFLLGGGDEEAKVLSGWAAEYPDRVISLAGVKAGFKTELALMSYFDAMLTMDSANMHLASIVGTPTVSVWGATHPYCGFKGWKQSDSNVVQLSMTCRPCSVFGNKACFRGDYHCMAGIPPRVIIEKVGRLLTAPEKGKENG